MESNFVTVTKLSAGHIVYILCWWCIALPLRQRWSVAIPCWRLSGCSIKDQRMLKVLLMRGKLPLMASGQREGRSTSNIKDGLFCFCTSEGRCISNWSFLIFLCCWGPRFTPGEHRLVRHHLLTLKMKFSISHHCSVCCDWPPLDKWWLIFQRYLQANKTCHSCLFHEMGSKTDLEKRNNLSRTNNRPSLTESSN